MKVNFIECTTLHWVLFREERIAGGGYGGTTYTSPHVILGKVADIQVTTSSGTDVPETKIYFPGIYRTKNKEGWQSG